MGCDIIITNTIKGIDTDIIEVPIIIRADQVGWIPTFDIWPTKISNDTSYIECTQKFRPQIKNYEARDIDPKIGCYEDDDLIIYWKALVNSSDLESIHNKYNGKLRATSWQKRYCTYFGTGSKSLWLHSVILDYNEPKYAIHHINGVSVDNRHQNLHILLKKEHDSINHPKLEERKLMFADPQQYWQRRKSLAVEQFILELASIITTDGQTNFIVRFAESNKELTKQILEAARVYINLSSVKPIVSENRRLNPHLGDEYLDTYEIEKYLKKHCLKATVGQLKLF